MRTLTCSLLLLAATAARGGDPTYTLEFFPFPPPAGLAFGDYSALSNSARLSFGFTDPDFDPVGVIEVGGKTRVFRVGTPFEDYAWYNGINEKQTTVGYKTTADWAIEGWIRTKNGTVRTFDSPDGDVFLYRLNDQDVAVGELVYGYGPDGFWRPVIADKKGLRVVDPPGVAPDAKAYFAGINNAGAIVGGTTDPDTGEHTCLLWEKHRVTAITHEGAGFVAPRAINNKGQVAGFWEEAEIDPVLGNYRRHGFIREKNGTFRTVDIEYPWAEIIEDELFGAVLVLVGQTTEILDMNDRGELLIQATGWYDWDGFVIPVWTYAIGTPTR
jgi:hypothetical protein